MTDNEVKFIGTAALHRAPREGMHTKLDEAARAGGKDKRRYASILYKGILVDLGVDINRYMTAKNAWGQVKAVVIGHTHEDHCAGLANFKRTIPVYLTKRNHKTIAFYNVKNVKFFPYGGNFEVNGQSIKSIKVKHSFTTETSVLRFGNEFIYSPDLGDFSGEVDEEFAKVPVIIADGSSLFRNIWRETGLRQHVSIINQMKHFKKYKNLKLLMFTHIGPESIMPAEQLELYLSYRARQLGLKCKVAVAFDLMELNLDSYK